MELNLLPYNNIFGFKFEKIISWEMQLIYIYVCVIYIYVCVYTTKFDYQCVNKLSDLQWIDINIYIFLLLLLHYYFVRFSVFSLTIRNWTVRELSW